MYNLKLNIQIGSLKNSKSKNTNGAVLVYKAQRCTQLNNILLRNSYVIIMYNMHILVYSYIQETGKYRDQDRGVLGQEGGAPNSTDDALCLVLHCECVVFSFHYTLYILWIWYILLKIHPQQLSYIPSTLKKKDFFKNSCCFSSRVHVVGNFKQIIPDCALP